MINPAAPLQPFDAWHQAMNGDDEHEQMRQRRLNAMVGEACAAAHPFYPLAREMIAGPFVVGDTMRVYDELGRPTHLVTLNAAGDPVAIERI